MRHEAGCKRLFLGIGTTCAKAQSRKSKEVHCSLKEEWVVQDDTTAWVEIWLCCICQLTPKGEAWKLYKHQITKVWYVLLRRPNFTWKAVANHWAMERGGMLGSVFQKGNTENCISRSAAGDPIGRQLQ